MHRFFLYTLTMAAFFAPHILFAQNTTATLQSILLALSRVVGAIVPVVFALILLGALWGIAKFVLSLSEDDKAEGKSILMWAIVALFVASSIWGIVAFLMELTGTGGAPSGDIQGIPQYN